MCTLIHSDLMYIHVALNANAQHICYIKGERERESKNTRRDTRATALDCVLLMRKIQH